MNLSENTLIRAKPGNMAAHLEGGSFVLELTSGTYFRLNELAGRVWQLLEEPTTIARMSERIASEYAVEENRCRQDIKDLSLQLFDEGLITTVEV